jgi:3-oxoadipate enol-lactonase
VVAELKRIGSGQRPAAIIAALQALKNRPDSVPTLAQVAVPTLILVGEKDAVTPPAMAEALHRSISGSTLTVISGARHLTPLEQPNVVARELMRLLAADDPR